jgi:hypothetical protein
MNLYARFLFFHRHKGNGLRGETLPVEQIRKGASRHARMRSRMPPKIRLVTKGFA